ncbi:MAG: polysaccharide biosynthesis tyrosine autokinase [Chloroflexi bacterium]|nr:polysaccharide biosynthesis tyrosine autokinase [Chloroflexota bacterium]
MEISQYLSIARRWAWLLILGMVLGAAGGYWLSDQETRVYQASTRIMVSRAPLQASAGSDFYYISDQQLTQTYIELLTTNSVLDRVHAQLGYEDVYPYQIQARQVNDTRIVEITIQDTNPQRTVDIANALVQALKLQNEEIQAGRYAASEESLQTQVSQVQSQISSLQSQIDQLSNQNLQQQIADAETQITQVQQNMNALQKEIDEMRRKGTSTAEAKAALADKQAQMEQMKSIFDLYQQAYANLVVLGRTGANTTNDQSTQRISQLQTTLSLYQQIYVNLLNNLETVRFSRLQNTQSVDQIETPELPFGPISPQPMRSGMLAGAVGLMLAAGIVFLVEYLDDSIKTPEDVERLLELPLIGYIAEMQMNGKGESQVYVSRQPRSPVSEAFRSLRTNLEFSAVDKPLRTILVTGAEAGDGKTTIAANLAAIFAQGGKRVLLMDCDLRRPRVHRFLGIQNRVGLTDLFREGLSLEAVTYQWSDASSKAMSVITSGSLPPNPAELLGSHKMNAILAELTSRVDVVVIDSPPSLVSDAQILAAKVDGVLLVVQPGKTHAGAARAMREQLDRAGARVVGAVFNRIPRNRGYYYGGYRYYSPYYYQNDRYLAGGEPAQAAPAEVIAPQEKPAQSLLSRLWKRQNQAEK